MGVHASCVPVRLFGLSRPRGATVSVGVPKPVSIGLPMPAVSGVCVLCGDLWGGMWGSVCMGVDTEALACDPAGRGRPFPSPPLLPSVGSPAGSGGVQEFPPPLRVFLFSPIPTRGAMRHGLCFGSTARLCGCGCRAPRGGRPDECFLSLLATPHSPFLVSDRVGRARQECWDGSRRCKAPPPPSPLP